MHRNPKATVDYETRVRDVNDLRAFALASDLGSVTAAARTMGESKATVSRRITRLEESLGVALLRRSSRGFATTDEGIAYRRRIGEVLQLLGDANATVANAGDATPSGELRISVPPGFGNALAPLFASFCERHPEVRLVVHISSRFVDLEAEHFDLALRATTKLPDSTLIALRLHASDAEGILVAAPSYLKGRKAPRSPDDLASHKLLAVGDTGAAFVLPLVRQGSAETMELRLRVAVAGSDVGFVKEMALHGAGIAVLPRLNVERELARGALVRVLTEYAWPSVPLFLLHRGGPFAPPKVRAFVEHARGAFGEKKTRGRRG